MNHNRGMPPLFPQNTNIGDACTGLQCRRGLADRTAMIFVDSRGERSCITFGELEVHSNQIANTLADLGYAAGDVLSIFLPKEPQLHYAFLGGLKLNMVVSPLFFNFGSEALLTRLADGVTKCLITRASSLAKLNSILDQLPALRHVLVTDLAADQSERVLSLPSLLSTASGAFETPPTAPNTPSIMHFTSGSTGKPKGVLHTHGALWSISWTAKNVLGLTDPDIYWCTADQGWVTGTSYGIIGPWSLGVTQVHFGGNYDPERWMKLLQDEAITIWYTAPTALRMLRMADEKIFWQYDLTRLRSVFSVGEPLNAEVFHWGGRVLGKTIYDTWFQTETGSIMIANRPGLIAKPGSMGQPIPGINVFIRRDDGSACDDMERGDLCLEPGWPSMFLDYCNNHTAYLAKFRQGAYCTGDTAYRDSDGYYWFTGRSDDIINTAGHLVSPFEVESCLLEMGEIAEAGVIAAHDELLFEKVVAFVVLKPGRIWSKELLLKTRLHVSKRVSSLATPQDIRVVERIPKTKSGKIMRRVLRAEYLGEPPGDISTMED